MLTKYNYSKVLSERIPASLKVFQFSLSNIQHLLIVLFQYFDNILYLTMPQITTSTLIT